MLPNVYSNLDIVVEVESERLPGETNKRPIFEVQNSLSKGTPQKLIWRPALTVSEIQT
jgi:hypothetical protein